MLRRLPTALAAAAVAHCIAILTVLAAGYPVSSAFLASHALVVLAVQLGVMLVGGIARDRAWAAAVFVFPVVMTLRLGRELGNDTTGMVVCMGIAGAIGALWISVPRAPGSPLAAAAAGGLAAAGISFLRVGEFAETVVPVALGSTLVATMLAAAMLAPYFARRASLPDARRSLLVTVFALVLSGGATALPTGPTVTRDAPPRGAAGGGPPVVMIVLDTVRADHLALHGYERDTMPNLERFAREHAVIFDRGIANGSSSLPSHGSLFTGLYPPHHGAHQLRLDDPSPPDYGYPLPNDVPTLSALLSDHGYFTVGVSGNFGPLSPEFGLSRGFHSYSAVPGTVKSRNAFSPFAIESRWPKRIPAATAVFARLNEVPPFRESNYFMDVPYRRAATITDAALEALELAGGRPFFLFLNYLDAHRPYYAPYPYRELYPGRSADQHPTGLTGSARAAVLAGERDLTAAEHAHITALYDGELSYLDAELERLFEGLRAHPSWNDMLVLITSDHGEVFGEHGHLYHSIDLYDESLHVPTLIKPGSNAPDAFTPGSRHANPIQSVDLFATALAHSGVAAATTIDGVAWGQGREEGLSWLYVATVNLKYGEERFNRELEMIERDGFRLIRSSEGTLEIYDVANDPGATRNLAERERARAQTLVRSLDALGIVSRAMSADGQSLSDDSMTRLRALGYVE